MYIVFGQRHHTLKCLHSFEIFDLKFYPCVVLQIHCNDVLNFLEMQLHFLKWQKSKLGKKIQTKITHVQHGYSIHIQNNYRIKYSWNELFRIDTTNLTRITIAIILNDWIKNFLSKELFKRLKEVLNQDAILPKMKCDI